MHACFNNFLPEQTWVCPNKGAEQCWISHSLSCLLVPGNCFLHSLVEGEEMPVARESISLESFEAQPSQIRRLKLCIQSIFFLNQEGHVGLCLWGGQSEHYWLPFHFSSAWATVCRNKLLCSLPLEDAPSMFNGLCRDCLFSKNIWTSVLYQYPFDRPLREYNIYICVCGIYIYIYIYTYCIYIYTYIHIYIYT